MMVTVTMALIEANELPFMNEAVYSYCAHLHEWSKGYDHAIRKCQEQVMNAPVVDVAPVVHGRWLIEKVDSTETIFKCSKCGRKISCANGYFFVPSKYVSQSYPYCHCGADMRKDGADFG